ncbi:recombinase family protein [Streptomyces sp. NPDC001793]|uniref:recombinase family protein n=1 Tax=Streptomyces sp. NPDC001793 TaxID=3154657 RepID=UPI00332A66A2
MVSIERGQRQGPATTRRTEDDLRRRQALANAAAGIPPGEVGVPTKAPRINRFRCVIYLCSAPGANIAALRTDCTEYADAFCWEITDVIEDDAEALPPGDRSGLRRAVERISSGEAGAVVTAWRSMISPVAQEYDQVARDIEQAGGFLHVMGSAPGEPGTGSA